MGHFDPSTGLWRRSLEPERKQFWMAGAGVKNFQMVELEPEIGFPFNRHSFLGK